MAPATKYGAKIVPCQPGMIPIAKSQPTTECTESTSGVARAARSRYARLEWRHCSSVPFHPSASIPYTFCRHPVVLSRTAATSGIRPKTRKVAETVKYVEMAKTSHTSGDLKLGQ